MEIILSIIFIICFIIWYNKPEWKATNRTTSKGKRLDAQAMSNDRTLNGMSQRDVYKKQCQGGYDVPVKKYETWEEWKAKRTWGNWN